MSVSLNTTSTLTISINELAPYRREEGTNLKKLILLVSLVLVIFCYQGANAVVHNVNVGSNFFTPPNLTVDPGDTVHWTLVGGIHTATSTPASTKMWDSGLLGGSGYEVQFVLADGPGPFPYDCTVHGALMTGSISVNMPPAGPPIIIPFLLDESGENFCAGTGDPSLGYGVAILSPDSTKMSVYVSHNVSSPTGAHVHLAAPCSDGGIVFPFSSSASPISQVFNVTPSNVADLLGGLYYVNIHTGAFPNGAIRGQIVATPIRYIFELDEAQEVPTTNMFSNGCAVVDLSSDGTQLSVYIEHDVANTISGHLHFAPPGADGAIQFPFVNPNTPVNEVWSIDTTNLKNLINKQLYANIHSMAHPGGEIRGQVIRDSAIYTSLLDGAQAAGGAGTGSINVGFGVYQLSADLSQLTIYVEHDIASPIDGHIHYGVAGVEGPIAFPFSSSTSPIMETWNLDPDDVDSLLNNGLYVNIHTAAFPAGEIRGQLVKESIKYSFKMNDDQENLCAGNGSVAVGNAQATLKPFGRQLNLTAQHNVALPIDAHVHGGPVCVNGGIIFPFPSSVSPMADIWYSLGTAGIIEFMQKELYVNIHSTPFPGGEIRGQFDTCCVGIRGDANSDGNAIPNVLDLNYMVNRIFRGGAPYQCLEEADMNGDSTAGNVIDLNFLVNRIFRGGPLPGNCPT